MNPDGKIPALVRIWQTPQIDLCDVEIGECVDEWCVPHHLRALSQFSIPERMAPLPMDIRTWKDAAFKIGPLRLMLFKRRHIGYGDREGWQTVFERIS